MNIFTHISNTRLLSEFIHGYRCASFHQAILMTNSLALRKIQRNPAPPEFQNQSIYIAFMYSLTCGDVTLVTRVVQCRLLLCKTRRQIPMECALTNTLRKSSLFTSYTSRKRLKKCKSCRLLI